MYCPLLENLSNAFSMWDGTSKLIGELPEDLFMYCTKLKRVSAMFSACRFTGTISDSLFRNNTLLTNKSVKGNIEPAWHNFYENISSWCK